MEFIEQWNVPAIEDSVFDKGIDEVLNSDDSILDRMFLGIDDSILLNEPSLLDDSLPFSGNIAICPSPELPHEIEDYSSSTDVSSSFSDTESETPLANFPKSTEVEVLVTATDNNVAPRNPLLQQETDEFNASARALLLTLKPKKPKRALTAYNLFFKDQRNRLLERLPAKSGAKPRRSHGKIGFADMARTISTAWKEITPEDKMEYEYQAELDRERFEAENEAWKKFSALSLGEANKA